MQIICLDFVSLFFFSLSDELVLVHTGDKKKVEERAPSHEEESVPLDEEYVDPDEFIADIPDQRL